MWHSHQSCVNTLMCILDSLIPVCLPIFPCLTAEVIKGLLQSNTIHEAPTFAWPKHIGHWVDEDVMRSMEELILPLRNEINDLDFAAIGISITNKTNPMSELSMEIFINDHEDRATMKVGADH